MPVRCISSLMMSGVTNWRNPDEKNDQWIGNESGRNPSVVKRISAEIVYLFIATTTSTVESVAYATFALMFLPLYPITGKPCKIFFKLLQSSSFTVAWGLTNALDYNFTCNNLFAHESIAREKVKAIRRPFVIYRTSDKHFVENRFRRDNIPEDDELLGYEDFKDVPAAIKVLSSQGARFFIDEVLEKTREEARTDFIEQDPPAIMPFILFTAVFTFAVGERRKDNIPNFFKKETKQHILEFRERKYSANAVKQIAAWIKSTETYEDAEKIIAPENLSIYKELFGIANIEISEGILLTGCWSKAIDLLEEKT